MLHELKLDTIREVQGGKVDAALSMHLKRVIADCSDRPGDKATREVNLSIKIKPIQDADGFCETVNAEFEVSSKVPKHVSRPVNCGIRKGGKLVFNELSEDNVDQMTIE